MMQREAISFNIVGCCVCRDIFRLNPCEKFKVDKFVQFVSPLSIVDDSKSESLFTIEDLDVFEWTNFVKRNVYFDFHWGGVENHILKGGQSDYLILDLCELRFKPTKVIFPTGKEIFVTGTRYLQLFKDEFSKFKHLENCILKEVELSQGELDNALDKYIAIFRKYYNDKQIILINNYPVKKHLDDVNKQIVEYPTGYILKIRNMLKYCYQYIENKYPDINVIEVPDNALGSVQHLWGKDPLHFVDDYYDYLFKAVKIVVEETDNQKERLNELKEIYTKYFNLLEKQKRMEYFIQNKNIVSLLPNSAFCVDADNNLSNWEIILSRKSIYDKTSHNLSCGDETVSWAILLQDIDKDKFKNQTLIFSVKYETLENSILNIAFTGSNAAKKEYLLVKQVNSNGIGVDSITFLVPDNKAYSKLSVSVYLNQPNSKAIIYETKLEYGSHSTLF